MEVVYPYPPERVWRALTDSRILAKWLLPNDFEPRLGHRFHFVGKAAGAARETIQCEVIELQPPHRLSYTWLSSSDPVLTVVTWVLETVAEGTRLRLEHRDAHNVTPAAEAWEVRLVRLQAEISQASVFSIDNRDRAGRRVWRTSSSSGGTHGSWQRAA
jgi:uncharacterized protein YndB with AHSA1/START domain